MIFFMQNFTKCIWFYRERKKMSNCLKILEAVGEQRKGLQRQVRNCGWSGNTWNWCECPHWSDGLPCRYVGHCLSLVHQSRCNPCLISWTACVVRRRVYCFSISAVSKCAHLESAPIGVQKWQLWQFLITDSVPCTWGILAHSIVKISH